MHDLSRQLAGILQGIRRPGDFYASGSVEIHVPRIEVDGVGPIALPVLPAQAEQLIAVAERAPYGRGARTLRDLDVRRTWQIAPDRVRIDGRRWPETLAGIVARAAAGLGVDEPVDADLYKLLVYDPGSFFVPHRDTEKAAGMFATLVIALPSTCSGGELVICHDDRRVSLDLRCAEPSDLAFAAFYADCVHEVRPIVSGFRVVLVYSLRRRAGGAPPSPPDHRPEQAQIVEILLAWAADAQASDAASPRKLVHPLAHAYSPAELSFAALKNADAAIASVLVPAAANAGCDVHLALLSIEEVAAAEYDGYPSRGRRGRANDDDYMRGEVIDQFRRLSEWRRPDGEQAELADLPFDETELCPPDAMRGAEPDEEHFHEATGNEGATFERTYSRAALVLWPRAGVFAVIAQAGLPALRAQLDRLMGRWAEEGAPPASRSWHDADRLATYMTGIWPGGDVRLRDRHARDQVAHVLDALVALRDLDRVGRFLGAVAATGNYGPEDNVAIARALGMFGPARAGDLLRAIVTVNAGAQPEACGALLARVAADAISAGWPCEVLHPAATTLVGALPESGRPDGEADRWERRGPARATFVADLLTALVLIGDSALARHAVEKILAAPRGFDMDGVLVPAALILANAQPVRDAAAIDPLRAACVLHLAARIALPLEPPRDWRRAAAIRCRCEACADLARFLVAPDLQTWVLKAPQDERTHVEQEIARSGCDLDFRTLRRGSPHSLVCTKTRESYERRVRQRQADLAAHARLAARRVAAPPQ